MLIIRTDQKNEFREEVRLTFVLRLYNHLQDRVPGYLANLDPETALAHVENLVADARELGFRTRNQIRRYAVVEAAASGHAAQIPPAWLPVIANRPRSSAPMRLLAMEDTLLHHERSQGGRTP
jgi:hypothetical protein